MQRLFAPVKEYIQDKYIALNTDGEFVKKSTGNADYDTKQKTNRAD